MPAHFVREAEDGLDDRVGRPRATTGHQAPKSKSETPNDRAFWCQIGGPAITRPVKETTQLATAPPGIKLKTNHGGRLVR